MIQFPVHGKTKLECLNGCRELEDRDFECIGPIKEIYQARKVYDGGKYVGIEDYVTYRAVYRKVSE